jgi:hypothetical protein
VVNASVLVAPRSTTTLPVSCVEEGRWGYRTPHLHSGGSHASSRLRHVLRKSVHQSASDGHSHASDQGEVWLEVGRQARSLGARSATGALCDTYDHCRGRIGEFRDRLRYVEGATGVAGAIGRKVVSVDLFDRPATCRKVWGRLLSGLVLDALEATPEPTPEPTPEATPRAKCDKVVDMPFDVLEYLISSYWQAPGAAEAVDGRPAPSTAAVADVWAALEPLNDVRWQPGASVGAGQEFRARLEGGCYASALVCGGAMLHGSLVMAG